VLVPVKDGKTVQLESLGEQEGSKVSPGRYGDKGGIALTKL
jgi:hypothetical protein